MCDPYYNKYYWFNRPVTSPSPEMDLLQVRCQESKKLLEMFVRSLNILLVVLSVLELCVVISSATLSIKALTHCAAKKSAKEPETKVIEVTQNLRD